MAVLSREAVQERLRDLSGWELAERALRREFQFKTFRQAMAFVNAVAERAQAAPPSPPAPVAAAPPAPEVELRAVSRVHQRR